MKGNNMSILIETDRLKVTEMTMDMAMDVHKNSLDEDVRKFVPIDDGKWEIGYHVAKAFTGKGYATEAVTAFLPVMAKRAGVTEVYGIRLLENKASGRVLEKCGFEIFFTGMDSYHEGVYEIAKSVWKA